MNNFEIIDNTQFPNHNDQVMIVTRGVSNSGKSTKAKEWMAVDPINRRQISRDNLRAASLNIATYEDGEEPFITKFQREAISLHLTAGRSVVIDDMNLRAAYVRAFYDMAKNHGVKFVVWNFAVDLDVAIKRSKNRAKDGGLLVPEASIRDMYTRFTRHGMPNKLPDFEALIAANGPKNDADRRAILVNPERYMPDLDKPVAIIVDIDGTLTMGIHPDRGAFEWAKVGLDLPNEHTISIVKYMADLGYTVIVTSGREDTSRVETVKWLEKNEIPFDKLLMRKAGDDMSDDVVKLEIFNREIRNQYHIRAVFDDRQRVVRMWHAIGLPLFRVGDPDSTF